ncbi:MAG: tRNA uridine-5-carboxymethylaminomethyl(34) synthesis enzyme MnmG [Candidatus Omnitrophota bacterium]|jgi:tRNA uridine 5-carboxymethylaminomethyl modification enzyme|nr:MAG: tRNA uridine-5-carboxymethylaminomethyl(34) synthesis enzyme MnmG [Candidatus Omnitrophota bacterium]
MNYYDVIVIGAGHAGIEASLASARMKCVTALLTMDPDRIGFLSCNPAIGGVGKGQLVKEIDALGGKMAKAADSCAIQFRMLNASKGAAVHSSRAQIDSKMYNLYMSNAVRKQPGLSIIKAQAIEIIIEHGSVIGVKTSNNEEIFSKAVIVCPGTFLDGIIHIGLKHFSGGRLDEPASINLASNLKEIGFNLLRFKTGTCPRLDKNTIDFSSLIIQQADHCPVPFSFSTKSIRQKQVPCFITYTNTGTHAIIKNGLSRSPLYTGKIKSTGVRYCPSIEDKIVRFSDKEKHQVFLEPEGLSSELIYPNGLSTSLPEDVQLEMIHSIDGLKEAKIVRFGYGIEHTVAEPTQLFPTLETKLIKNLYLAGQINGTTGYEEAAAQGLIAGINAALRVKGREQVILDRSSSYIGVLIDDLTTKGTLEPYRMFTSRVEYRLIVRQDNADHRLSRIGYEAGLVSKKDYEQVQKKYKHIAAGIDLLKKTKIKPVPRVIASLSRIKIPAINRVISLEEILRRPQVHIKDLVKAGLIRLKIPDFALPQVETEVKYSGFIQRQLKDVERFKNLERIKIPESIDYKNISGVSHEIKEKLARFRPLNLGQASRISGVTPAAISLLMVYLKKING